MPRLTRTYILANCVAPGDGEVTRSGKPVLQRLYMDAEFRGFGVLVTRNNKAGATYTFIIQREVRGRTVRVKIGRLGDISVEEARRRALKVIGEMLDGVNPNQRSREEQARAITVANAIELYADKPARRSHREKSPATKRSHRVYADALSPWHSRQLSQLSRADVLAMFKRLSVERGPVGANNIFRYFRAVYNSALLVNEHLPPNPVLVLSEYWNPESRKRRPVSWEALPEWVSWANVDLRRKNPVRADLQLFLLFSGLRSEDARSIRTDEIDLTGKKILRPKPKGGEDRAYDLPLSCVLQAIIARRIRYNPHIYGSRCEWLFPTVGDDGSVKHIVAARERDRPSPHRLRDTYLTAAHEAHVPSLDQKILVNHMLPLSGDVTDGYKRPSWDYLVEQQEVITRFLLEKAIVALVKGELRHTAPDDQQAVANSCLTEVPD